MSIHVNNQDFQKVVLESDVPVVVDFWAEWCGPCRALSPILDEASQELGASAKITKVNIDENPELASQYGVRSIPTLILFKDGKTVDTRVGGMSKTKLLEWIRDGA